MLLIPIEIEIKNYGDNQILDYRFKVDKCDWEQPYIPYFETDSIPIGFNYDKLNTISEYKMKKITIYSMHKIFLDSLPSHRKFIQEYKLIKRNNNAATGFQNDTIRYKDLDALKAKHSDFLKENIQNDCDEITFFNTYYNKILDRLAHENIILKVQYK